MHIARITPAALWLVHREAAGGKSTVTGAPLPETINECQAGPQATHYAMACFIAAVHDDDGVMPIPPLVKPGQAEQIQAEAQRMARSVRGLASAFAPVHEVAGRSAS